MPVYQLDKDDIGFPDPQLANEEGIIAVGGDLSVERLLEAYALGIFPWYDSSSPILWWSPNPRLLLKPQDFILRKSFKRVLKKQNFKVFFDRDFEKIIDYCGNISRNGETETWITPEMKSAYIQLHHLGWAHSVAVYEDQELVGGLYGVSLGKAFFGESMFFKKRDASKVALYYLCRELHQWGFHFIDAQVETNHMLSLGAQEIDRTLFLKYLETALAAPTCLGKWTQEIEY
ncbi:MAG: leucyl/phenylalanyl-tRNA--protein transferase [Bacteroidetes bacterium 4572_77]|nr:MAG: leucyl/phenylalanyl-tRNA--protein transferase [Bacteroidetes bacterium 4572_77]